MSKELSKSKESIFSSSSKKKDQVNQLEFEGFLHVTMCLHRPISVANEVALDFSLESVGKNMRYVIMYVKIAPKLVPFFTLNINSGIS